MANAKCSTRIINNNITFNVPIRHFIKFKNNYIIGENQQRLSVLTCNRRNHVYNRMTDKEPGPVVFWNDTPLTHRYSHLANICTSELRRDYGPITPWGDEYLSCWCKPMMRHTTIKFFTCINCDVMSCYDCSINNCFRGMTLASLA